MPREYIAPAPFTDEPMPPIELTPVESSQIAAIGYDAAIKTLAVRFNRGAGAIYHYPDVEPEMHRDFMAAESIGSFFGQHIKTRAFKKYPAPADSSVAGN